MQSSQQSQNDGLFILGLLLYLMNRKPGGIYKILHNTFYVAVWWFLKQYTITFLAPRIQYEFILAPGSNIN